MYLGWPLSQAVEIARAVGVACRLLPAVDKKTRNEGSRSKRSEGAPELPPLLL